MFLDHINLRVQAGDGGHGCESYMRRTDKKAVPDGGDGGKGGRIILRADHNAPPLQSLRFRQHIVAESGAHGGSNRCRGRNGKDTEILVPVGTRIFNREKNLLIRDLSEPGEEVVVVEGGEGGAGNYGGKQATSGRKGGVLELELVFRIHADVFLVGIPNSGKTTLMNSLTGTHAKTEVYPFATDSPAVGVFLFSDYEKVTFCDLPSLYRASHEGRGRGRHFLTHLENAKYIFFVIDPVSEFAATLGEGLEILRHQIAGYRKEYANIPAAVLVNKMDLEEAKAAVKEQKFKPALPCFYISALTGEGLPELKDFLKKQFLGS